MRMGARSGCHQRSDRSLFYHGHQFPVCARCTGVLIGYILSVVMLFFYNIPVRWCIIFCWIMFADWLIQFLRIRSSTNIRRLITGILGGCGIMTIEIDILIFLVHWLELCF